MTPERRLAENIKRLNPVSIWLTQGEVVAVDGLTCRVRIGNAEIEGVRLRASLTDRERQILTVPKVGSAVTLGCLTADLNNLVVLQVDEVERIEINGGQLGGLINIEELTAKINELVDAFNGHTHSLPTGTVSVSGPAGAMSNPAPVSVPAISKKADKFTRDDYEDDTQTSLVNTQTFSYIVRKDQPLFRVFLLIPFRIATEVFLVLPLQLVSVNMIWAFKTPCCYRAIVQIYLLKKRQTLLSAVYLLLSVHTCSQRFSPYSCLSISCVSLQVSLSCHVSENR